MIGGKVLDFEAVYNKIKSEEIYKDISRAQLEEYYRRC